MIKPSREVVKKKRDNAKLVCRNNGLVAEFDDCRAEVCLARDRFERAESRVKTSEAHVEKSDTKCSKTVEEAAYAELELHVRIKSFESSLEAEKDRIARSEKECVEGDAGNQGVFSERQKAHDALKFQLREKEMALSQTHVKLSVAHRKLEELCFGAKKIEKKLSIARASVSLQTTLRAESREQLDERTANLKEAQARLEMREDEFITMCVAQTKVATEKEQLRTQTGNKKLESVDVESVAKESERTVKRAKVIWGSEKNLWAPSTAAYSALLAERDEFKDRCNVLMLEN